MPETGSPAAAWTRFRVVASFESYLYAEHRVAALGRDFRRKARKGDATAVVIRANADGSMKGTESRVLSASDLVSTVLHLTLSWTVGFLGLLSTLKGTENQARAARAHEGHVGSSKHRAHEILAGAGPHAAIVLIRCHDTQTHKMVAAAVADGASESWEGSLSEFLATLDPGSTDDWVRAAVGVPAETSP